MKTALSIVRKNFTNYDHAQQEWNLNGVAFKTLWVPFESSNRTAAINLNHAMGDFIGCDILIGANGNCGTGYAILPIPAHWTEDVEVTNIATALCSRLGKTSGYRVLKADDRLRSIIEEIVAMAGEEWSTAIYGDVATIDLVTGEEKLEALKPVNQQMVRDVVRIHKATGRKYVTKADAAKLRNTLHRYPKDHHFKKQFIGVSFWMEGRMERSIYTGAVQMTPRLPGPRNTEQATIEFYDVRDNDKGVLIMVGDPTKAIAELDRVIAADDARLKEMVEQTWTRGVRVSRPGHTATVVHTREEVVALLPQWGLTWNDYSHKYMDNFLDTPLLRCALRLPNSGPIDTVLTRL
jgi:hypothetical protein